MEEKEIELYANAYSQENPFTLMRRQASSYIQEDKKDDKVQTQETVHVTERMLPDFLEDKKTIENFCVMCKTIKDNMQDAEVCEDCKENLIKNFKNENSKNVFHTNVKTKMEVEADVEMEMGDKIIFHFNEKEIKKEIISFKKTEGNVFPVVEVNGEKVVVKKYLVIPKKITLKMLNPIEVVTLYLKGRKLYFSNENIDNVNTKEYLNKLKDFKGLNVVNETTLEYFCIFNKKYSKVYTAEEHDNVFEMDKVKES